jgi:hypothetical protein
MNQDINQGRAPIEVYYEVIETNADLEELGIFYQGFHRDIAETVMYRRFKASACLKDFMLINQSKREIVCVLFSERTKALRNECQG